MAQNGILLITDITGYSKYVNQSELEHAQSSLTDLLNLLIDYTRSPLVLSKLEGDAVFSYAPYEGFLQGQTLVEMVEATYLAFRKALELMILNTTCQCAACRNLKNLDLKFFVHCGSFTIQKLGEYRELLGNDVNLVHRLAKNHIKEQTGHGAYAAYTQAVVEKMGLGQIAGNMIPHRETFADVGEVQLYVQDMHHVWENRGRELRIRAWKKNLYAQLEFDLPYPLTLVWQYITDPRTRYIIFDSVSQEFKNLPDGRLTHGAVYLCAHGDYTILQTMLDWEPFDQYTTVEAFMGTQLLWTLRVIPAGQGTRLQISLGPLKSSILKFLQIKFSVLPKFAPLMPPRIEKLKQRIAQDLAESKSFISSESHISERAITEAAAAGLSADE
jgi:hypothetical protein